MFQNRTRSFVTGFSLGLLSACGVKAAPTPVLDNPQSPLLREVERRAAEKQEKEKEKDKGKTQP
ncbi:hypothetical protein EBR21_05185 [bacterium]|nr:hypothetical protein [bacterium]